MLDTNVQLALISMLGALIFMIMGYLNQIEKDKKKCETTEFKTGYVLLTLVSMVTVGMGYENMQLVNVSFFTYLFAFFTGLGANGGLSKFTSLIGNLNGTGQAVITTPQVTNIINESVGTEEQKNPDATADIIERAKAAGIIKE